MSSVLAENEQIHEKNGISVLIVEDDSIQSFVLAAMAKSLNYKVLGVAKTGEQAIQMSADMNPDIILMDITLEGEMDGIDAAIKIQESSNIKLIYITGNSGGFHIEKANQTKYVAYLNKPINRKLLSETLEKNMEIKFQSYE